MPGGAEVVHALSLKSGSLVLGIHAALGDQQDRRGQNQDGASHAEETQRRRRRIRPYLPDFFHFFIFPYILVLGNQRNVSFDGLSDYDSIKGVFMMMGQGSDALAIIGRNRNNIYPLGLAGIRDRLYGILELQTLVRSV